VLAPHQLLARLEQGVGTLGPGPRDAPARQQTLRATIDWSYALLSEDEKALLGRLSVFRGGWTLETMDAIAGGDLRLDLVEGLGLLVDKSLVRTGEEQNGAPRFRMLETVRQYAWEQLSPGEAVHIRKRHRDWFLQFAERGGEGLQTAESSLWHARLRADEHNLHAALNFCLADEEGLQAGLRFANSLSEYWHAGGAFREARAWLSLLLARVEEAETSVYARALTTAAMLAKLEHDFPATAQLAGKALEIGRALGDRDVEALALH
jgi:non-specific serine/threonine protein kinase